MNKDKELYFVAGLPRSGSTLLMNVLGQNPKCHVTPTNGLIELFCNLHNNWHKSVEFRSQGLKSVQEKVRTAGEGLLHGFYKEEFEEGKVVFDKNRGWLQYIEELEYVLDKKIKVIACVRDPREIAGSLERVYRERKNDYRHASESESDEVYVKGVTIEGRCQQWFADGGLVGIACNRLRDALKRVPESVILLPYNNLVDNSEDTMDALMDALELDRFKYDFEDIQQLTHEDDCWHGMDLHIVGNKCEKKSYSHKDLIPKEIREQIKTAHEDLIKIC